MKPSIEKGPIRPPSEARSLLFRVTRSCPWNRCAFCHTYSGRRFELRTVEEIRGDIRKARDIADRLAELSRLEGNCGRVTRAVVDMLCAEGEFAGESIQSVAAWLHYGGKTVFLQDADSLVMRTSDLVEAISYISETFPSVQQITSYCRSRTAARKSATDLKSLYDAGLTRIHVGLESGYDPVLQLMKKGVTAAEHVEGGRKLKAAGFSLCAYVMPGLGGSRWSKEHAEETAGVINLINPDFVRLRSLHVVEGSALSKMVQDGSFIPLGDEDVVREIRRFIECLNGIETTVVSDHVLNLLEELEGKLPEAKPRLLAIIDRFFALSPEERLVFRLGRRKGLYRRLDDLADRQTFIWLKSIVDQYAGSDADQLERDLNKVMNGFI
jgi:histone acetyltransferase (RNA polymerase elongator complex component)